MGSGARTAGTDSADAELSSSLECTASGRDRTTGVMKVLALLAVISGVMILPLPIFSAGAPETWTETLSRMPLPPNTILNRDNCMRLMLEGFQSNATVRGLVFLPGVSDDFYLISRDKPKLNATTANLAAAIGALTNGTDVRATFHDGLLVLHLRGEAIEPAVVIKSERNAAKLKLACSTNRVLWIDRHWDKVQPELSSAIGMRVVPGVGSKDAWHFARHNLAAWNVT